MHSGQLGVRANWVKRLGWAASPQPSGRPRLLIFPPSSTPKCHIFTY